MHRSLDVFGDRGFTLISELSCVWAS